MRFLIEVPARLEHWHNSLVTTAERPRLPLPFSCLAAFQNAGHQVSGICLSGDSFEAPNREAFKNLYGRYELERALLDNDLAFFWAGSGIKAIISNLRLFGPGRKVLLGSYVWGVSAKACALGISTWLAAHIARGVIFLSDEQVCQARQVLPNNVPVRKFTWGIDSAFYRSASSESDLIPEVERHLPQLLQAPYVILAGDQQRMDEDAITLVERFNIRLVRVPQERETASWYRRMISEKRLEDRLFVFEQVPYSTLRFLLQNAQAYVGLVDSTWQPAGWTVLCEALASGTSAVVYEGLTPREMQVLGAGNFLTTVPYRDIEAVAEACARLDSTAKQRDRSFCIEFARDVLDLEHTGPTFVKSVEAIFDS